MHFVWSLLLSKIINILQILQGGCKLLTSTVYIATHTHTHVCVGIHIYAYILDSIYRLIESSILCEETYCDGTKTTQTNKHMLKNKATYWHKEAAPWCCHGLSVRAGTCCSYRTCLPPSPHVQTHAAEEGAPRNISHWSRCSPLWRSAWDHPTLHIKYRMMLGALII